MQVPMAVLKQREIEKGVATVEREFRRDIVCQRRSKNPQKRRLKIPQ